MDSDNKDIQIVDKKNSTQEVNTPSKVKGTIPRKSDLYKRTAKLFPKSAKVLKKLLDDPNPLVRLGAVKLVYSRTLPELKAVEITGQDGQPIKQYVISMGNGFIPVNVDKEAIEGVEIETIKATKKD